MRIFNWMLSALLIGSASTALAIFDGQLLVGQRSGNFTSDGEDAGSASGMEIQAAFHLDPIPLVPVGAGVYVNQSSLSLTDMGILDASVGLEAGLQLYAWLPIGVFGLKPYAKLSMPLYSAFAVSGSLDLGSTLGEVDIAAVGSTSGPHFAVGGSWSPIPLLPVAVLLEASFAQQTYTIGDFSGDTSIDDMAAMEANFNSMAFYVGVQAGL